MGICNATKTVWKIHKIIKGKVLLRALQQIKQPCHLDKNFWTILKTLVNRTKAPIIPYLLKDDKFVTNFLEEPDIFNGFFRQKYKPISNDSTLHSLYKHHAGKKLT